MDSIYTIGHSTHPIEEFLDVLRAYDIQLLVDVRRCPDDRGLAGLSHYEQKIGPPARIDEIPAC
jgi:uncharacterized protein (DUF488 family)